MKEYIKKNLEPIAVGCTIANIINFVINVVSDLICKLAILYQK
jgi:hypothetical protein